MRLWCLGGGKSRGNAMGTGPDDRLCLLLNVESAGWWCGLLRLMEKEW